MSWLKLVLLQPLLLLVLYTVVIQYERESLPTWLRNVLKILAVPVLIYDSLLNLTLFNLLLLDMPRTHNGRFEWTLSNRLSRLKHATGLRGAFSRRIASVLDFIAPSGRHIE